MNSKFLSPALAIILAFTTAPICMAQTTSATQSASDWQGLNSLKRGKQILIEYKCKFVSIAGTKLTVSAGGYQATIEQADIQSVYRLNGKWSRGKMAKVGAGIGMLVGTFVGSAIAVELESKPGHIGSEQDTFPAFAGCFIGTAAGAGLGALVGGKRKGHLLYEAR